MPQTYSQLYYHVVFSTKNREPLIRPEWRDDLHSYLGGMARNRRGELIAAGGIPDHMHLLLRLPTDLSIAVAVRDLKAVSSGWRHEQGDPGFFWQRGYGAFTVSRSMLGRVERYILTQEEHHRTESFQDEYRRLLRKHGIEFDEEYVWD